LKGNYISMFFLSFSLEMDPLNWTVMDSLTKENY
jgi:hypothetical protein